MGLRAELKAAYKHKSELTIPVREPQGWFNFRFFSVLESVGEGTRPGWLFVPACSLFSGGLFSVSLMWFGNDIRYSLAAGSTVACALSILYTLAYCGLIVTHVVEDRQMGAPVEIVDEKPQGLEGWRPIPDLNNKKNADYANYVRPMGIVFYLGLNPNPIRLSVTRLQVNALAQRIRSGKMNIPYKLVNDHIFERPAFEDFIADVVRTGAGERSYRNQVVWTQDGAAAIEQYDRSTPLSREDV